MTVLKFESQYSGYAISINVYDQNYTIYEHSFIFNTEITAILHFLKVILPNKLFPQKISDPN